MKTPVKYRIIGFSVFGGFLAVFATHLAQPPVYNVCPNEHGGSVPTGL